MTRVTSTLTIPMQSPSNAVLELAGITVGTFVLGDAGGGAELDSSIAVSQEVSTGSRLLTSNLGGAPV
jgi:hypothetical protein